MHLFACCICAAALSTVSAADVAARLAAERLLAGEDRVSLGVGSPDAVRLPDHDASAAGCGEKKCYLVLHEHFYANDASGYGGRSRATHEPTNQEPRHRSSARAEEVL